MEAEGEPDEVEELLKDELPEPGDRDSWDDLESAERDAGTAVQESLFVGEGESAEAESEDALDNAVSLSAEDEAYDETDKIAASEEAGDWVGLDTTIFDGFEAGPFGSFETAEDPLWNVDADFDLDDYDEGAQQQPWEVLPEEEDKPLRTARYRAASLAAKVETSTRTESRELVRWLTELFRHLSAPATFRALSTIAEEGIDAHTLRAIVALRHYWMERPDWWVRRLRIGRSMEIVRLKHGPAALTWRLARRICEARADYPPSLMIAEDWLHEWYGLPPYSPGYLLFPHYLDIKLAALEGEAFCDGWDFERRLNGAGELADPWDWMRAIEDRTEVLRGAFPIRTPFDEQPGQMVSAAGGYRIEGDNDAD
ncbi:MAG: hypothetical protein WD470_02885 [Rhodospirillaceae bacterium]